MYACTFFIFVSNFSDAENAGPHEGGKDPISAAAAALPVGHRRRERENMAEFLSKKREIFLVQARDFDNFPKILKYFIVHSLSHT